MNGEPNYFSGPLRGKVKFENDRWLEIVSVNHKSQIKGGRRAEIFISIHKYAYWTKVLMRPLGSDHLEII